MSRSVSSADRDYTKEDTRDRDCANLSTHEGHFFQVTKYWEVELGGYWRYVFSILPKIKELRVFWELLEML
jgi:hypothetical protein